MPLLLEIVTPERQVFSEEVDSVVCPGIEGLHFRSLITTDGQHDHGDLGNAAKLSTESNAIHLRHLEIRDHEVGMPVVENVERGESICGDTHVVAMRR